MKKVISIVILLTLELISIQCAAKKMSKEEQKAFDTVIVTLKDGTVVNGVVKKYWNADLSFLKPLKITITKSKRQLKSRQCKEYGRRQ